MALQNIFKVSPKLVILFIPPATLLRLLCHRRFQTTKKTVDSSSSRFYQYMKMYPETCLSWICVSQAEDRGELTGTSMHEQPHQRTARLRLRYALCDIILCSGHQHSTSKEPLECRRSACYTMRNVKGLVGIFVSVKGENIMNMSVLKVNRP